MSLFLRLAPLFVLVCVLVAACAVALRINLPWLWFSYFAAMLLTHFVAFLFLFKTTTTGQLPDKRWLPVYMGLNALSTVLMLVLACDLTGNLKRWLLGFLGLSAGVFACAVSTALQEFLLKRYQSIPSECQVSLVHASALFFCGVCTLASFIPEEGALGQIVRGTLGLYWLLHGCAIFLLVVCALRFYAFGSKLNLFLPAVLGIIAFSWLAYQLGSLRAAPVQVLALAVESASLTGGT